MKFHYYPDTDSLHIELSANAGADSHEAAAGAVLDFDSKGCLVGIDIDHASNVTNLATLEIEGLPRSIVRFVQ